MKLLRNARISAKNLFAHRLRTLLSVIGVTLGVATVIVLVAVGEGARREVIRGIDAFGTHLLIVKAGKAETSIGREKQSDSATSLTLADAEAIAQECASVATAVPTHDQQYQLKYGSLATSSTVVGTTPDYLAVRKFELASGRFFTAEENRASIRSAVLGAHVRDNLFGENEAIGEVVRIGRIPFEVVGVLEAKGESPDGADQDNQIVIPLRTAMRRVFQKTHIELVYVEARSEGQMRDAQAEITGLLRQRHRLDRRRKADDFVIQNLAHIRQTKLAAATSFTTMIAGVASVSLWVGGIGILSTMLLSARERRLEIGLRMAMGARRRDILAQFLLEALALGLAGGSTGVLSGLLGALAVGYWTRWTTTVPTEIVVLSLAFSLTVGLVFGIYPARRASLLDPIEALRGT